MSKMLNGTSNYHLANLINYSSVGVKSGAKTVANKCFYYPPFVNDDGAV